MLLEADADALTDVRSLLLVATIKDLFGLRVSVLYRDHVKLLLSSLPLTCLKDNKKVAISPIICLNE
jgi:hypothetical protein